MEAIGQSKRGDFTAGARTSLLPASDDARKISSERGYLEFIALKLLECKLQV